MMNEKLFRLMNGMNCEWETIFLVFFAREKYLSEMQNKVEDKNINLRKKRYRTNHCVAEQEIYNHHLIVHSKPKVLGLGTDQVVKESPKVKNLTVYRSCFLLATPLIQKYLIILKKIKGENDWLHSLFCG